MKDIVRRVKQLRTKQGRQKYGCVIVEGYLEVRQALRASVPFEKLYVCPALFHDEKGEFDALKPTIL